MLLKLKKTYDDVNDFSKKLSDALFKSTRKYHHEYSSRMNKHLEFNSKVKNVF